jgi:inositol-1,3,4-trisphosphate 5/6-kinase/inositol-tetrakisphosphate 1-kinase
MTLVFNEQGLSEAILPCLVQSFVNHNAILYKIFALGKRNFIVERPSIKNLYECHGMRKLFLSISSRYFSRLWMHFIPSFVDLPPIHFNGGEISKPNSSSQLNVQDKSNSTNVEALKPPCPKLLNLIAQQIQQIMGLELIGIDVAVEDSTGR